ncbi:MAG: hypothetical protein PHW96_02700 [Candidatus Nanoarchaeia archaeon]|nr:hypothetical protein [Candidatus Nanoarchaeia archaeon]
MKNIFGDIARYMVKKNLKKNSIYAEVYSIKDFAEGAYILSETRKEANHELFNQQNKVNCEFISGFFEKIGECIKKADSRDLNTTDKFNDFRESLVELKEYIEKKPEYVNFPKDKMDGFKQTAEIYFSLYSDLTSNLPLLTQVLQESNSDGMGIFEYINILCPLLEETNKKYVPPAGTNSNLLNYMQKVSVIHNEYLSEGALKKLITLKNALLSNYRNVDEDIYLTTQDAKTYAVKLEDLLNGIGDENYIFASRKFEKSLSEKVDLFDGKRQVLDNVNMRGLSFYKEIRNCEQAHFVYKLSFGNKNYYIVKQAEIDNYLELSQEKSRLENNTGKFYMASKSIVDSNKKYTLVKNSLAKKIMFLFGDKKFNFKDNFGIWGGLHNKIADHLRKKTSVNMFERRELLFDNIEGIDNIDNIYAPAQFLLQQGIDNEIKIVGKVKNSGLRGKKFTKTFNLIPVKDTNYSDALWVNPHYKDEVCSVKIKQLEDDILVISGREKSFKNNVKKKKRNIKKSVPVIDVFQ